MDRGGSPAEKTLQERDIGRWSQMARQEGANTLSWAQG